MGQRKDRQELDFYQNIFDANEKAACIIDGKSQIRSYNSAFLEISKIQQSSLIDINILDALELRSWNGSDTQHSPIDELSNAISARKFYESENIKIIQKDNSSFRAQITISPFVSNNEQFYQVTLEDVTQELKDKQSQVDFISLMSHELRTPIATINGYLELALNPDFAETDDNAKKYITSAHESTDHLSELLKSLLSVTLIDSEDEKINLSIRDINERLKNYSKEFFIIAKNKGIKFTINIRNEELYAKINPIIFREVLTNLVNNAIKYTPSGGSVELSSVKIGNKINIAISDTGEGIKEEDLENIFEKFYRATSTKEQGSGLGLYLAKRQVEKMGGKISVESTVGQGSTFIISFPIVDMSSRDFAETFIEEFTPMTEEEINSFDPFAEDMSKYVRYPKLTNNLIINNCIELSKKWSKGEIRSASEEEKQKAYNAYKKQAAGISQAKFDKLWAQVKPRLDNIGLIRLGRYIVSKYIISWLLEAPSCSTWELAFGYGYDYEWNWKKVEKDDPIYWFIVRDPQFNWIRQRTILSRKEISNKNRVLFLSAGCLPELRHIEGMNLPSEIWACDDARNIDPDDIFGWSATENKITYEKADILDYLDKMAIANRKFDTIVMDGGSFQNYGEIDKIITSAVAILESGGKFIFDVQPLQWDHELLNYVLGVYYVDETVVPKDIQTAIKTIKDICDNIGGVRTKYTFDKRNDKPAGIMFYIEKI